MTCQGGDDEADTAAEKDEDDGVGRPDDPRRNVLTPRTIASSALLPPEFFIGHVAAVVVES